MDTIKLEITEYKGSPLLSFSTEGDRYPFSFGKAKARKILAFIQQNGVEAFMGKLTEFVGEENVSATNIEAEKPLKDVGF